MPFKSEKQRRFMWAKHPEIAEKWAHGKHSGAHEGLSHARKKRKKKKKKRDRDKDKDKD